MAGVSFSGVRKDYGDFRAVEGLDLEIHEGEFVALLGPSGCGKTTTLRMLAGLEFPSSGEIRIGERVVNDLPPGERDIAMVFQSYALYPHMTVARNIEYPLKKR
ncbi:MAG: ABC transporter ATP-binding protein, partial [Pseudomonadota bacterium]